MSEVEKYVDKNLSEAEAIFAFLKEMIKLRNSPVKRLEEYSKRQGYVISVEIEEKAADTYRYWMQARATTEKPDSVFTVPRVKLPEAPTPSEKLQNWVNLKPLQEQKMPNLYNEIRIINEEEIEFINDDEIDSESLFKVEKLEDHPEIISEFNNYTNEINNWLSNTEKDRYIYDIYQKLHIARELLYPFNIEDMEIVLGIGRLKLNNKREVMLDRHLFYIPLEIEIEKLTGTINVTILASSEEGVKYEDDWISGIKKPKQEEVDIVLEKLNKIFFEDWDGKTNPLKEYEEKIKVIISEFANLYRPELATDVSIDKPKNDYLTIDPMLIFRKKNKTDLIRMLESFEREFKLGKNIPNPLKALLEPGVGKQNANSKWSSDGSALDVNGNVYTPISLNQKQRKGLESAESRNATIIQGPPGTGKTRTIAAMMAHFLAKGQRVLVVSQKSQALREVHSKLPDGMKELAVASLGNEKSDKDHFFKSITALVQANEDRSELQDNFDKNQEKIINEVKDLNKILEEKVNQVVQLRSMETEEIEHEGETATRAIFARNHLEKRSDFEWLEEISDHKCKSLEISEEECLHIERTLQSIWSNSFKPELNLNLPEKLYSPEKLNEEIKLENIKNKKDKRLKITEEQAKNIIDKVDEINNILKILAKNKTSEWVTIEIEKSKEAEIQKENSRIEFSCKILNDLQSTINNLGNVTEIDCAETSKSWLPLLEKALQETSKKGDFKLDSRGSIKLNPITQRNLKGVVNILDKIKINGKSISTSIEIERAVNLVKFDQIFISYISAQRIELKDAPNDRTERLLWLKSEELLVKKALTLNELSNKVKEKLNLYTEKKYLKENDILEYHELYESLRSITAAHKLKEIKREKEVHIDDVIKQLKGKEYETIDNYILNLKENNLEKFTLSYKEVESLKLALQVKKDLEKFVIEKFSQDKKFIEFIVSAIDEVEEKNINVHLSRIKKLSIAFKWKSLGEKLNVATYGDYGNLFNEIKNIEKDIEVKINELTRLRAWKKALDRIDQETLTIMSRFALEVKKLGAGKGKTANRRKREIKKLLRKSVSAIPAWIMPIDEVPSRFPAKLELFDVIIVDEASQARVESLFLLALAKRIVVVGDDKQVSPDGGMLLDSDVQNLINKYLKNSNRKSNWSNINLSLFDECKVAFGNMITLTEHRRCVPEIIEFSNIIAYQGDNIRLVPVRQTGSSSLTPIKMVYMENADEVKTGKGWQNPYEAEYIANEIKRISELPEYDGKTIGVVTIQGQGQKDLINKLIDEKIDYETKNSREIRVGTPADFQGAERDIIFISMVVTKKYYHAPQTKELMVQRFNVATSRAKDQLVVVHSIKSNEIVNKNDLRRRLLEYCEETINKKNDNDVVSEKLKNDDILIRPFKSVLQQKIYNKIVEKGYKVIPNYKPEIDGGSMTIDLVIVGDFNKIGIKCDGDSWDGEELYRNELKSQRILETTGWKIYRIQESTFFSDAHSLDAILEELNNPIQSLDKDKTTEKYISIQRESNSEKIYDQLLASTKNKKKRTNK